MDPLWAFVKKNWKQVAIAAVVVVIVAQFVPLNWGVIWIAAGFVAFFLAKKFIV